LKPPPSTDEKLHKVLAAQGLGSRREMERWIEAGRVKVNGRRASVGDRVGVKDKIQVDGKTLAVTRAAARRRRVLVYNKPEGEIATRNDPEGRPTVFDRLPRLQDERWIMVGRLDLNTSGLLLFTNDGEVANRLMHPSTEIEREYACRILGPVDDAMLQRLAEGVLLEDGTARFSNIRVQGGRGANRWFSVTIREGRNREVRRLWESQQVTVSRLKRVRFGSVSIPSLLKPGDWLELTKAEVDDLCRQVAIKPRRERPPTVQERQQSRRQLEKLKQRGPSGRRSR
jgi:23S rRNA pseudouridine2605 synthase